MAESVTSKVIRVKVDNLAGATESELAGEFMARGYNIQNAWSSYVRVSGLLPALTFEEFTDIFLSSKPAKIPLKFEEREIVLTHYEYNTGKRLQFALEHGCYNAYYEDGTVVGWYYLSTPPNLNKFKSLGGWVI
jgi:hypothetical protein